MGQIGKDGLGLRDPELPYLRIDPGEFGEGRFGIILDVADEHSVRYLFYHHFFIRSCGCLGSNARRLGGYVIVLRYALEDGQRIDVSGGRNTSDSASRKRRARLPASRVTPPPGQWIAASPALRACRLRRSECPCLVEQVATLPSGKLLKDGVVDKQGHSVFLG